MDETTPTYLDAHCHLEREHFGDEVEAAIARATAAGVREMIAVGASGIVAGADEAIALAERHENIFAAVAIHPHEAHRATDHYIKVIEERLSHPKVVAIGEIGLDYYYDFSPEEAQLELFRRFLVIARERDLPVVLHLRETAAHRDCVRLIDELGLPASGGVVHCFSAGPDEARSYLDRGMYLSIPGIITFKNAELLREAVAIAPMNRLLVETDAPYLAPVPLRGKRNEPAFIGHTAAGVGAVKGLSGEEVGRITRENALRVFGLPI